MKQKLSVVLATYNESANIGDCLQSVKNIADEIIIVDGSSEDNTREIAESLGAKVIKTTNKPIFHINKQMAVDAAKGEWILSLDADERVSKALAHEIEKVMHMSESQIQKRRMDPIKQRIFQKHVSLLAARDGNFDQSSSETVAFFVPRLNMFLGRPMRYTGVYPDGVIRLFKRGRAKYPAKSVHEQIQVNGRVDWLEQDLLHYDSPTFSKYLLRSNRYTDLTAQEFKNQKVSLSVINTLWFVFLKPLSVFLKLFLRHKGFKDGFAGFVFSVFSGLHFATAYMKYWQSVRVQGVK